MSYIIQEEEKVIEVGLKQAEPVQTSALEISGKGARWVKLSVEM